MRGMNEYKIVKFSSCEFSLRTFSESYLLRHFIINYGHVLDMTGYHTPYSKMTAILVFFCLIANWPFWPGSRLNILLNFTFKSEAKTVNLQSNKRILKWQPFWNKAYRSVITC